MRTYLHRWLPTVIAVLALVVAMGGPGEAKQLINGKHIKKGSVASKQLKNGSLTGIDVKDGSLSGPDLTDGSVTGVDVADGTLTGAELLAGSVGSQTLTDAAVTGAKLSPGSVGATKLQKNSVTGPALDAAGSIALDFGTIAAHTCALQAISIPPAQIADGTLFDDVVMVTPGAFFALNFSWTVKVEGQTIPYIKMCNVGDTSADPDAGGTGKNWQYVAIDVR